ncbi:hypothetical protein [Corynebacterium uberis]|uniref:hypothetical protein n=1 Tax=uncultured Corynebacterium sp. TaxID=159447 RepID=UPI00288BB17C|nr:hypothetical protein [uncultured Corynebacterium sp.]
MTRETPTTSFLDSLAPGALVLARDEEWMVTSVGPSEDGGQVVHVRGMSEYVKDQQATFYTALEPTLEVLDPREVTVVADESPRYRKSRIWVESILRNTPVPLYQSYLEVSGEMLMHPLGYQRDAVRKALSVTNIRPRLLLADAVGLGKTLEIGMILAELVRRGAGSASWWSRLGTCWNSSSRNCGRGLRCR